MKFTTFIKLIFLLIVGCVSVIVINGCFGLISASDTLTNITGIIFIPIWLYIAYLAIKVTKFIK